MYDALGTAEDRAGAALRRVEFLQRSGEGGPAGAPGAREAAQRGLDEAVAARAEAQRAVDEASASLRQLQAPLQEARERHSVLRRQAAMALDTLEPSGVASLTEARAHIELLQERLRSAEARPAAPAAPPQGGDAADADSDSAKTAPRRKTAADA